MIRYLCADCRAEKHLGYTCPVCRKATNIILENTGGITNPQTTSVYELASDAHPADGVLDRIVKRLMNESIEINTAYDYDMGRQDGIDHALQIIKEERERSGS